MSLLFRVVFANECTSTHHKLALDALRHLEDEDAERWRNLFLYYFDAYLDGSKAPDTKFKDFKNHVLHVQQNGWGGAIEKANEWYLTTVREFRRGAWSQAIYAAGVLSHYLTDPFMPFHTAQSEAETQIHRAVEWSVTKSYDAWRDIMETSGGYPEMAVPEGNTWLAEMITTGAELGNRHYQTIIDHYNLDAGVKDPPSGLDAALQHIFAQQLGRAMVGFARVLERIFDEADVEPPRTGITLAGYLATLTIPMSWVTKKIADASDRKVVKAMYAELQRGGRVDKTLPADDREVRRLHAEEVLHVSLDDLARQPLAPMGQQHGVEVPAVETSRATRPSAASTTKPHAAAKVSQADNHATAARYYLMPEHLVVDAPSIGPKTAKRLAPAGIKSVRDLLDCDPEQIAKQLRTRHITPEVIEDWQDQASLVCTVPNLRGHDAQVLVACDFTTPDEICAASVEEILAAATQFATTREGRRILGSSRPPDREEITNWLDWARQATQQRGAA